MSKGELKARITELFYSESLDVTADEEEIEIQEGCILCESEAKADVFSVLDEATKEFPPIMQKMLKEQGKHAVGWRLTDLQKWFEKWFGDEK
jgi:hypothetical protein